MTKPSDRGHVRAPTAPSLYLPAGLTFVVALLFVMSMLLPGRALAQGFAVSPMFVEASLPAGRTAVIPLEVFNSSGLDDQEIIFELVDLGQARNGSWVALGVDNEASAEGASSARSWMTLTEDSIVIPAGRLGTVSVRAQVPIFASGTYTAAVLVRTREMGAADTSLRMQFEFLIPIIINIEGRPVRQNVQLDAIGMDMLIDRDGQPRSTAASVSVVNRGQSFSRFTGTVQIDRRSGDIWRRVTRYELPERAIISGAELVFDRDIDRRLPPGQYRMRADLLVDGRRVPPLQREFAFAGDPDIDAVAYDTELELQPPSLDLAALPGGARTNIVAITNPSDRPVEVSIGVRTPRALEGVAIGGMRGTALSGADWTEIRPDTFTLGPRQRRNVRMIARLPETAADSAWFYADIVLTGTYEDGQSAGETRTALRMRRQDQEERRAAAFERLTIIRGAGKEDFVVSARIANIGNVHLEPQVQMMLIGADGVRRAFFPLEGDMAPLLPLGLRDHAGPIALDEVPYGTHLLRVDLLGPGGDVLDSIQRPVEINADADGDVGGRVLEWRSEAR